MDAATIKVEQRSAPSRPAARTDTVPAVQNAQGQHGDHHSVESELRHRHEELRSAVRAALTRIDGLIGEKSR